MSGLVVPFPQSGMVPVMPMAQMVAEEKAQAALTQNVPLIQGLAGHVKRCFDSARDAKRQKVEDRLLRAIRQRRGEYDPEVLAEIRKSGGTEIFMMLTSNKCRAAGSWLKDVMFGTKDQSPWDVQPTQEPDITPLDLQSVVQEATQEALQIEMAMGIPIQTPEQMHDIVQRVADRKIAIRKERAMEFMRRMRSKMEDQLQEGGYYEALDAFIDDLVTFPFAMMKGPVPRKRKLLQWQPTMGAMGQYTAEISDVIQLEWERVDPFKIYWAPYASNVDDGYLVEHHTLTRGDLESLDGVEGYDSAAIRAVLDEYGKSGLNQWLEVNASTRMEVQGKSISAALSAPDQPIDALQYWGCVQGKMLIEWGMDEAQVPDPLKDYECEIWVIGQWVIKAVLNTNPMGYKPYYKTSFECVPGAWDGNGIPDLMRDTQRMCNAAARALANNMGIASGPQVSVMVDRLAAGEDVTQIYPWRIWQMTSDPYGGTAKPVEFFMPGSNAQELMMIYEKFSTLADEYSGIPRYMTGDAPAGGAGRTASGMSMLMSNAGKSIKQVVGNVDMDITQPLIERLYYYNMKYSEDPMLKGDVRVVARGVNVLVAKEQAQVRMNEILNIVSSNPIFVDIVGPEAIADLLREVTRPLNIDVVPPKEVVRARILQQQQLMMMQAQAAQDAAMQEDEVDFEHDQDGKMTKMKVRGKGGGGGDGKKVMPGNRQQLQDKRPVTDNFAPSRK